MELRKATKKIVAVSAAAAIASASVFGAANYPQNFVENGNLDATVVYGSSASSEDVSAAQSIVADLESDYSGSVERYKITYHSEEADGESIEVSRDRREINYNETVGESSRDFDTTNVDLLADTEIDKEDFTQAISVDDSLAYNYDDYFTTKDFRENYGEDAMGAYKIDKSNTVMTYTLEGATISTTSFSDVENEKITLAGNEFTITEMTSNKLTLLGGSDKLLLAEESSAEFTLPNGEVVTIEVKRVDTLDSQADEALITVNGISKTIQEGKSEDFDGITLAANEMIGASGADKKGYVQVIVGGYELVLQHGKEVQIDGDDISDLHEMYKADVKFKNGGSGDFTGFDIIYKANDKMLLTAGGSFEDKVFNAFSLTNNGDNSPEYNEVVLKSSSTGVSLSGTLTSGNEVPDIFRFTTDDETGSESLYVGSDSKRLFHENSNENVVLVDNGENAQVTLSSTELSFGINDSTQDVGIEGNFLYRVSDSYDYDFFEFDSYEFEDNRKKISISGKSTNLKTLYKEIDVENTSVTSDDSFVENAKIAKASLTSVSGNDNLSQLFFENGLVMDFSSVEQQTFNATASTLTFSYDGNEMDASDSKLEDSTFVISMKRDSDRDDEIVLDLDSSSPAMAKGEESYSGDDDMFYVDSYGTMVLVNEDKDEIVIKVPQEEISNELVLNFGQAPERFTVEVSANEVDSKVAELEAQGNVIVGEPVKVTSEAVSVNVSAPMMDSDVSSMSDLIVVGGPAVNSVARDLLNIEEYSMDQAGVEEGQYVHRYFEEQNVVLVYGYSAADTQAGVNALNSGSLKFN